MLTLGLLALVLRGPAFAQDGVPAPSEGEPTVLLTSRYVWEQRGTFPQRGALVSVSIQPRPEVSFGGDLAYLAMDASGAVWRSDDRGATWALLLDGLDVESAPDDEDILLQAEQVLGDELEAGDDGVDATAARAATDDVAAQLDAAAAERAEDAFGTVWFHPTEMGVVLAGRPDGIWRSDDLGLTWLLVDDVPAEFFAALDGAVVAGTRGGVRWSLDAGISWIDVEDATDGARVRGLTRAGAHLYAATGRGMYRSQDGLRWSPVEAFVGTPVLAVVADPDWQGGLWVATPGQLQRSDDDGRTFYVSARTPLRDVRRIVHLGGQGHLLALTADGPWESGDGGVRWVPLARLLTEPDVREVALDDGLPVIATRSGLFRLTQPTELAAAPRPIRLPPLAALIASSQGRNGLDTDLLSLSRRAIAATLAPNFLVTFDWDRARGRDADFPTLLAPDDMATIEYDRDDWALQARLCWGSCAGVSGTTFDASGAELDVQQAVELGLDPGEVGDELFVVGSDVYDDSQVVAAAANTAQNMRQYRRYLATVISDAWLARQKLNQEQAVVDLLPRREQVLHALKIAELEARLDAYTNGAYSRALVSMPENTE
jgi:hypothetical protein